jgi:hypothetical protein
MQTNLQGLSDEIFRLLLTAWVDSCGPGDETLQVFSIVLSGTADFVLKFHLFGAVYANTTPIKIFNRRYFAKWSNSGGRVFVHVQILPESSWCCY